MRGPSVLVELYGMGARIRCMRCWCGCVPCRPCGAGPAALVSPAVLPSRARPVRLRFLVRVKKPPQAQGAPRAHTSGPREGVGVGVRRRMGGWVAARPLLLAPPRAVV